MDTSIIKSEDKRNWLEESEYDVILLGTGLTESILAGYIE